MHAIMCRRCSLPTVRRIVSFMEEPINIITEPVNDIDILIRWGSRKSCLAHRTINASAKNASDKLVARQLLQDSDIAVPQTWFIDSLEDVGYPCIARRRQHYRGKYLWVCSNAQELEDAISRKGAEYFSAIYPKTKEYRVHITRDGILGVYRKLWNRQWDTIRSDILVWNHNNGFFFNTIKPENYRKSVIKLATRALEVLDLDFATIDIMADPTDEDLPIAVISEVNTCPQLQDYTAQLFAKHFDKILRKGGDTLTL